jgi:hypothetical protein
MVSAGQDLEITSYDVYVLITILIFTFSLPPTKIIILRLFHLQLHQH